ncbi:GDSL-type esterase/lipase family protein [Clostridium sp.]|uniref:GDSL-type esterase/lipase family protein n=1 Tax=Clostridium sp. TaxID=1506 RepID=UPI003990784C
MPKRIHKIVLDSNKSAPLFEINKLDSLHLEVEVTEVETLENAEVELFFKKSDGTLVSEIISEKEQNILKIDVKNGALDVPGIVVGQAKITEEDGNISSHKFKFNIKNSITSDDAIVNEIGIGAIEELKKQIDNAQIDPEVLKNKIEETINNGDLDIVSKEELQEINSQLDTIVDEVAYLKNKTIVMMGDSIMDICGIPENVAKLAGANVYNVGFQGCTMQYMDTVYEKNKEFSGYGISKSIAENNFSAQETAITTNSNLSIYSNKLATLKTIDFSNVDIVTVAYGTNDFGFGGIVGTKDDDGYNNVAGAMKEIVKNLQSINSNMEIIFFTPIYRGDKFINSSNVLEDYVSVIKETASSLGIKVIDLFTCSGINEFNYSTLLKDDKLHPNDAGSLVEATAIVKYAKSGYLGKTNEEFQKSNTMVIDNENLLKHHINNRGCLVNNIKYLTHAKTDYLRFKDMVLVDGYYYIEKFDNIIIDFDYIDNSDVNARVDVVLYNSSNDKVVEKNTTLSKAENETHKHLEILLSGCDTGTYRLYIAIKAMDINNYIYIRNVAVEKKEYKNKIMCGSATATISDDATLYKECRKIYTNYQDWGESIIPCVTANCTDREIVVSVVPYWNHVDMIIEKKDGTPLTNGKTYTCNYIAVLPI